jgi:hypothetical protein
LHPEQVKALWIPQLGAPQPAETEHLLLKVLVV